MGRRHGPLAAPFQPGVPPVFTVPHAVVLASTQDQLGDVVEVHE